MSSWYPARRVLGLPAWLWVVLPVPLLGLGDVLWKVWPPSKLAEPSAKSEVFRDIILVTRDGDSFRFVPFDQHKGVKPLWAVNFIVHETTNVDWKAHYFLPGFFQQKSRWAYDLHAHRFDDDWKNDKKDQLFLPAEQVQQLRPLVVAELNRRNPAAKLGDRLEGMLTDGLEATSHLCPQNVLILLAWLSVPMALVSLISTFIPPRTTPVHTQAAAEPTAARDHDAM